MNKAEGRVALITGGSGAIGSAIASELSSSGVRAITVDVVGTPTIKADLTTADGNREMVRQTVDRFGRLDILVLNAGLQSVAPLADFAEKEWDQLQMLLVKGPFLAVQEAWRALTSEPGGRIVAIGSVSSFLGEQFKVAYVSAKHGLLGLVRTAALEGAAYGMTANLVAPGVVRTPFIDRQLRRQEQLRGLPQDQICAEWLEAHAVARFIEPREVAAAVGFLAGPRASAVTGICLPVDLAASAHC